jgi:hypothetical protein
MDCRATRRRGAFLFVHNTRQDCGNISGWMVCVRWRRRHELRRMYAVAAAARWTSVPENLNKQLEVRQRAHDAHFPRC